MKAKASIFILIVTMCLSLNAQSYITKIDSIFSNRYRDDAPGAAILIAENGKIVLEKYKGIADLDTKEKIDSNTRFNIASISKQFTVASILMLQEKGLLSINDYIPKYLDNVNSNIFGEVTLRHLMSHSSGIPDSRPRNNRDWMLRVTDSESIAYLTDVKKLKFKPGTEYDYINPTFQILYKIIESLSCENFVDFQQRNIFDKIGMGKTYYFDSKNEMLNTAHAYVKKDYNNSTDRDTNKKPVFEKQATIDKQGTEWQEYDYGEETFFATKADGGIYTTLRDLYKWNESLLSYNCISEVSTKSAFSKLTKVSGSKLCSYQNRQFTWYGLGFFIEDIPGRKTKVYHTGDNGGFQAYSALYPENNISIIILENRNDLDRWDFVSTIDMILQDANRF